MKKNQNDKQQIRQKSIRTKLMVIPIILIVLSTIAIIISVTIRTDSSMKAQMQEETEYLLANVAERLNDNNASIESIENIVESSLLDALNSSKNKNLDGLTNQEITELANLIQVDELNLINENGQIINSNVPEQINTVLDENHPIREFQKGNEEILLEDIKKDLSGDFDESYKYGAIRNADNSIFQVAIFADGLIEMSSNFETQVLINDLMASDDVVYASFIDNNFIPTASSDESYIGRDVSSEQEIVDSINGGNIVSNIIDLNGIEVYDIIYPVTLNDEILGSLRIGFNLDDVNNAIKDNIIGVVSVGSIVVAILIFVLYKTSNEMINIVNSLKDDTENMADGDFSFNVPDEFLSREDEFGEIARANMRMKESIRNILKDVIDRAEVVASYSEELTATAQDSESFATQLAQVIDEVADAATSQAHDVEDGAHSISELDRAMSVNFENLERLNNATSGADTLKDEGLELIIDLVDKTKETGDSVKEIASIIGDTNISADNITKAIEMIGSIAEQTNLLALNASIEAARAGESGRGFSVVAQEIRELAEESSRFTEEIDLIVRDLTNKTSMAVSTMDNLEEIVSSQENSVNRTDGKFQGISNSIEEINGVIEEVNVSNRSIDEQKENLNNLMQNLAAISEENAAGTEEAAASVDEQSSVMAQISEASEQLALIAEELNNRTSIFKI